MVAGKINHGNKHCHCHNHYPCPLDKRSYLGFNVYFAVCGKKKKKTKEQTKMFLENTYQPRIQATSGGLKYTDEPQIQATNGGLNYTNQPQENNGFALKLSVTKQNLFCGNSSDSLLEEKEETSVKVHLKPGQGENIRRDNGLPEQKNSFKGNLDIDLILKRLNQLESKIEGLGKNSDNINFCHFHSAKSTVDLGCSEIKTGRQKNWTRNETFDLECNDKNGYSLKRNYTVDNLRSRRPSQSRHKHKSWRVHSQSASPDGCEISVSVERSGKQMARDSDLDISSSDEE